MSPSKSPQAIDQYINDEPSADIKKALKAMRALVRKAAPKATEKLAWNMPTLYLEGNLVHFAAFQDHLSLFPGPDAIVHFKKELAPYPTSKGTIQFPYGKAVPAGLVTRIVKFCARRNLAKAQAKANKKAKKKAKAKKTSKAR